MKRKITVVTAAIVCSFSLFAQNAAAGDGSKMIKVGDKMISAAKLQRTIRKVQMKKTGGMIRERGSAKGTFVVLNSQKIVPPAALSQAMEMVDRWMLVQTSVKEMPGVGIGNIKEAIRKSGGVLGVAIVEDAALPGFMVAPEDGWAIVNVMKLGKDNPKPEILAARVRKETLRAFAFVSGGAYQAKGCSLMRDVKSLADIDALQERFGLDTVSHVRSSAPFYGLVPWYQTTYLKACEEGWAPAPTNEFQKAIWDKVHAMPTAPLKIKPETKKVTHPLPTHPLHHFNMKYTYAYKTSDGVRHEDSMNAASREEVFAELRKRGIKAIKVVAADGSKANGEVRGVRKRIVAVLVAVAALSVGVVAYFGGSRTAAVQAANSAAISPRHQIYGDPAIMESLERGDFSAALPREGDRLLAVFAQPGKLMCAKGTNPRLLSKNAAEKFAAYAKNELAAGMDIAISTDDPREIRELKQIVNGMRYEMRAYLANGNGTPRSFWRRLNERTLSEMQIYDRTKRELEKEQSPEIWEQKNEALRTLGLRTIPLPEER